MSNTSSGLRLLFAGTPDFAAAHLAALIRSRHEVVGVLSQPDKPGKRGKKLITTPVKALATEHDLPVVQPDRLSLPDLEAFDADVMVVVAYGQILRQPVLDYPRFGCINVHASLLPRWRGAAPIQRAIMAGDDETGVCIMQMDAGLDTGDVMARTVVPIDEADTTASLSARLIAAGCPALIQTLDEIEAGAARRTPQTEDGLTYAHKIDKDEAKIDWNLDAASLCRLIRAFNPDPIAFSTLGDLRVRVWEAIEIKGPANIPGQIVELTKQGLDVATGHNLLRITRLQLPVGKGTVMTPSDLMNARRAEFANGERFVQ